MAYSKVRLLLFSMAISLFFAGCSGPVFSDSNGWSQEQKDEFVEILSQDRYASLCNLKPLYDRYRESGDTAILSRVLVEYARNLSDSCIDIVEFRKEQKRRREQRSIHTEYDMHIEGVDVSRILSLLSSGESVDAILRRYLPSNPQYYRLLKSYHRYRRGGLGGERYRKLRLSLERSKLSVDEGWDRYFVVNIPSFTLEYVEDNRTVFDFPVVVGSKKWQTPVFDSTMKYVVINPTWNVPDNIARAEEIHSLLKRRDYFSRKKMIVVERGNGIGHPVDPRTVNWRRYLGKEYEKRELPYRLVQLPSGKNALGRVKFMFPNDHSVYMHDTPRKSLFKKRYRAYSHGCIRLSKPLFLLNYLADKGNLKASRSEVKKILDSMKTTTVWLNEPIAVHIEYMTAYVDAKGRLNFYPDVYGYDSIQKFKEYDIPPSRKKDDNGS